MINIEYIVYAYILSAYLLPAALIKQNGAEVAHFPTFFSEASCNTGWYIVFQ